MQLRSRQNPWYVKVDTEIITSILIFRENLLLVADSYLIKPAIPSPKEVPTAMLHCPDQILLHGTYHGSVVCHEHFESIKIIPLAQQVSSLSRLSSLESWQS
jgi:hypothetical protein